MCFKMVGSINYCFIYIAVYIKNDFFVKFFAQIT